MGCSQSLSVMRLKWEEGEGLAGWAGGSDEEESVDEIGAGCTGRVGLSVRSSSMVVDVCLPWRRRRRWRDFILIDQSEKC